LFTAKATQEFQKKYIKVFPSKNTLQLKIREVRQKLMADTGATNTASSANAVVHQELDEDTSQDSNPDKNLTEQNNNDVKDSGRHHQHQGQSSLHRNSFANNESSLDGSASSSSPPSTSKPLPIVSVTAST
jgi:hypothetical protein